MSSNKIENAARLLYEDHRDGRSFRLLPADLTPNDETEAYRIQDAFVALLLADGTGPIIGYKIALTSKAMQEMVGSDHPSTGVLLAGCRYDSPKSLKASAFQRLGIECELAVELAEDLPHSALSLSVDQVATRVAAIRPAFELIEDRNADYDDLEVGSLIADNAWNAGIVLGPELDGWRQTDLTTWPARLAINDQEADAGVLGDAMGHPFKVVAWLADHLALRGQTLKAGMVLMTGSVVRTQFAKAGESYVFDVADQCQVALTVEE